MLASVTWDSQLWPYGCENCGHEAVDYNAMFTLYRRAFAPARIGPLFTHENGDFGAISVTERNYAPPISKV